MSTAHCLPRLYSSCDDALFEEDDAIEPTEPRVGAPATGIGAFLETVVRELEATGIRRTR